MGLLFADVRVEDALYRHFAFFDKNFFFFIVSYIVLNLAIFMKNVFYERGSMEFLKQYSYSSIYIRARSQKKYNIKNNSYKKNIYNLRRFH